MKNTIFRKRLTPYKFDIKSSIKESNATYNFELNTLSETFTPNVNLFLSTAINKKDENSFLMSYEDALIFYEKLGSMIDIMDEIKNVNKNVIYAFNEINLYHKKEILTEINIDIVDEYPYGNESNGIVTLKVTPIINDYNKLKENNLPILEDFYINLYVTGVLNTDRKTFNMLLDCDITIIYSDKLGKKGKAFIQKAMKDYSKAMNDRMKR